MSKKKTNEQQPDELELQQMEFRLIMGDAWEHLEVLLESVFCTCHAEEKKLIDYNVFLNQLNDLVLRGSCSSCGSPAARYIETGENKENQITAERIRQMAKPEQN